MVRFIKGYECRKTTAMFFGRTHRYEFKISEVETEKVRLIITEISARKIHTPRVVYGKSVEDMIKLANVMAEREGR